MLVHAHVAGGGDHLGRRVALEVGDLLRPLVDEQRVHLHLGVVVRHRGGDGLEDAGLARLGRSDQQTALAAADGGDQVDGAAGDAIAVRRIALARRQLHHQAFGGVECGARLLELLQDLEPGALRTARATVAAAAVATAAASPPAGLVVVLLRIALLLLLLLHRWVHSLWSAAARPAPAPAALALVAWVVTHAGRAVGGDAATSCGVVAARSAHRRSRWIHRPVRGGIAGRRAAETRRRRGVIIGGSPSVRGRGGVVGHRFG